MSKEPRFRGTVLPALLLTLYPFTWAQQAQALSVELIDQRIAALEDAGTAEDDPALQAYSQAKVFLKQAAAFSREAAEYVDALASAPKQQAEIQVRIDRLDRGRDPKTDIADSTPQEATTRLALARAEQNDLAAQINDLDGRLSAREAVATDARARLSEIAQRIT